MIISAPDFGPVIAGFAMPDVNTRRSGSRCRATGFASKTASATPGKSNGWTKIKDARPRVLVTPRTALTQPLPTRPEGGQAVSKPMAQFYGLYGRSAATLACQSVVIMTAVVA